jgi:hypothetical protein
VLRLVMGVPRLAPPARLRGRPRTWILKPDGPHAMAVNEATCLRLAAACGLDVPETELLDVAGLPVSAVGGGPRLP